MNIQADLVCVGAGIAGLVAGLRAAELGLKVIVFEKGEDSSYPCNSRFSFGVLHAAHRDLKLPIKELELAMHQSMGEFSNHDLISTVAANSGRMIEWLQRHGVKFIRNPARQWVFAPAKPLTSKLLWKGMGPDYVLRTLGLQLKHYGGKLIYGTRVIKLFHSDDGACSGVEVVSNDQAMRIDTKFVVIADGGFQANSNLVGKYITSRYDLLFPRHGGSGLGDGIEMALASGAHMVGLNSFYGHLLSVDAFKSKELWPYPQIDSIASSGILVDSKGNRRLDEGKGGIYLANGVARFEMGTAMVICDNLIWDNAGKKHQIPPNPLLELHGATMYRDETIEKLAIKSGLPPIALVNTVNSYNEAVNSGLCEKLEPMRSTSIRPSQISHPPFFAIPVCAGITNTSGGISIDSNARVLSKNGVPIPGLYAAGATIGGLDGGVNSGYIGGLVKAVFGLKAAENASYSK